LFRSGLISVSLLTRVGGLRSTIDWRSTSESCFFDKREKLSKKALYKILLAFDFDNASRRIDMNPVRHPIPLILRQITTIDN